MARHERLDYCLVGEPSSTEIVGDVVKNGRRGSLTCNLTIHGVQGHVAYPHLADNPVHRAAPFLNELVAIEWDRGNDFSRPQYAGSQYPRQAPAAIMSFPANCSCSLTSVSARN